MIVTFGVFVEFVDFVLGKGWMIGMHDLKFTKLNWSIDEDIFLFNNCDWLVEVF